MAAKLTLNQKLRSVFSRTRRLRLEVLEDRRLLSAVAASTEDDSIAFICGTCGCAGDHDHDQSDGLFVALESPKCFVPDLVPANAVQSPSSVGSSVDSSAADQIFAEVGSAGNFNVKSEGIALQAAGTSRVTNESQLVAALLNPDVSEIIIDGSYDADSFAEEQIQVTRTLSITSEKEGFAFTGSADYPFFWISSGGDLTLSNVTVSDAQIAVYNEGTAKLQDCVIESSQYGIQNFGSMKMQNCIVRSGSYGIYNAGTFVGSQILVYDVSPVHFYSAGGTSTLYHCTFNGTGGSTIYSEGGTVNLYNSIVTGDTGHYTIYFYGGTLNGSGNIVNNGASASGDCTYTGAMPTFESDYSLTPGSAGINAVQNEAFSLDVDGNLLTTDLWGNARKSSTLIDVGAVERQIEGTIPLDSPTNVTISSSANQVTVAWAAVQGAASYTVRFQLSHPDCETSTWLEKTFSAGTTSWTVELIENATLAVQVIACGDGVVTSDSPSSATVQTTTAAVSFNEALTVNGTTVSVLHLHSNPTATRKIYLDFTGHMTYGTSWNKDKYGGNLLVTRAYSRDGSINFSQSELTEIYKIWKSVAEDYAPFDVDVTTEFPGLASLKRANYRDEEYGIRVSLGTNIQFVETGQGFGGIAFVGSFESTTDTPCFIVLMEWDTMKEAASHEVGHSVGLYHRGGGSYNNGEYTYGVKVSNGAYTSASGSWDSYAWCAIMGASYYADMTQWSDGQYYNAKWHGSGTDRGDLAVMTSYIAYRADDYGDYSAGTITGTPGTLVVAADGTVSTLGDVTLENSEFGYSGVISTQSDTDVFVLELVNDAAIDLHIDGSLYSNLDVYAALYADSDLQTALLEWDEFNTIAGEIQLSDLAAGTYYLVVDGVGKYDSNGLKYYSDYASLGYYTISGSVVYAAVADPLETPVLQFTNVTTGGLTVGWQNVANAAGYEVYVNGALYQSLSSGVTSCAISNLSSGTSYEISVTALTPDATQYAASTGTATGSTLAAPVPAALSMVYGSALPALTFTGGWQSGDVVKYSLTENGSYSTAAPDFSTKNVGSYTLFLKVERAGLEIWAGSTSVTVTQKEIQASEITWTNDVATYNGQTQSVSASYGGVALTVTVLNAGGNQAADFRNAGTYTASLAVSNSNYKLASNAQTHTLTMNKFTVSAVSWSVPALTYTGAAQDSQVSATFSFNGASTALNFTVSGTGSQLLNAGSYTLTAQLADTANFQWGGTVANRTTSATIGKYAVTLTDANWGTARSFEYDGQTHTVAATFNDLAGSGNILTVNSTGTNVGSYTLTAALKSGFSANYTLSGVTSQTVSITPFQITSIDWGTTALTYSMAEQTLSPTFDFNGATVGLAYTVADGKILRDAGSYTAQVVLPDGGNFEFADASRSASVSIVKFVVNQINWPTYADLTFTGQTQTVARPTFQLGGNTVELNISVSGELLNAGNYVVTASLADPANCEFGAGAVLTSGVKINPFTITSVTWTDPADLTYTGAEKSVSATFRDCDGQQKALTGITEDSGKTLLNAGMYAFTAAVPSGNYVFQSGVNRHQVTITPAEIQSLDWTIDSVAWNGSDHLIYDGQTHTAAASFTFAGQTHTVSVSNAQAENAGNYVFTAALVGASDQQNFRLGASAASETLTIDRKTLDVQTEIQWGATQFTYDGGVHTVSATFTDLKTGGQNALTVTSSPAAIQNVGTYGLTAVLTQAQSQNYALSAAATNTAQVSAFEITEIVWTDPDLVYSGTVKTLTAQFRDCDGELKLLTVTEDSGKTFLDAGTYAFTAAVPSANYVFRLGVNQREATITPFQITSIDWGTTALTYSMAEQTLSPTFDFNGATVGLAYTLDGGKTLRDAGNYTAQAVLPDGGNFEFADASRSASVSIAKFTVNQINWPTYTDLTFTGQTQTVTRPTFQLGGNTVELNISVSDELLNAGNYVVTASLADPANCEFGPGAVLTSSVKINPFTITSVTWTDPADLTYTGAEKSVSATFRDCDGQQKALTGITEDSGKTLLNAGTYAFTAAVPSGNYVFQSGANQHQVTITPAEIQALDWTIDSVAWNGSDHLIYDGQMHTGAASFTFAGQKHAVSVANAQAENAGTYAFTAALTGASDQQNFRLGASAASETLTIDRRTLDVQTEIQWGATQFTYDGGVHAVSATFTDLKTGGQNALTVTSSPAAIQNVGTYGLTAVLTSAQSQNYALSSAATNTAQVSEFEITEVVWTVPDLVYSGTVKTLTAQFRDCDGELKLLTVTEDSGKTFLNAGTYAFTAALPSANYVFRSGVNQHEATITTFLISSIAWDGWEGLIYDGTDHAVTASFTDALGVSQFLTVELPEAGEAWPLRDAGTFTLTAALGDWAGNYAFDSGLATTKDVTVSPREVTQITWSDCALTYTGAEQTVTASFQDVTGAAHPLDVTVNDGKTLLNVGAYTVTAGMNDSNYVFAPTQETTAAVAITPFVITDAAVTWTGVDGLVYDGTAHEAAAYFTFNGQNFALDLSVTEDATATAAELVNAGAYTLTASLKASEAQNFELNISPKSVSIAKAKIWAGDVTWSTAEFSYDAQIHEVTATAFLSGEPFPAIVLDVTPDAPIQNAGDYTLTASLTHANFELGEEITHAAKVTPFQIGSIDWGTTTRVYSDTEPVWTLYPTFPDWNGEPVSLTYTVSDGQTLSDVGTYTLVANLPEDAQNYVFAGENSVQVTITTLQRTAPTNLHAVGIGAGNVLVSWESTDSDFTLEFSRNEDFSESQTVQVTDSCETTLSLDSGETWFLRVRANAADSNHTGSDFSAVFQKLPIDLKGVFAVGTVDPESSAVSEEGIPASSAGFYSWDPFTVEVWTDSVHELLAGSQVQMVVTLDAEAYALLDSPEGQVALEGVSLEVQQGAESGEYVLVFTIQEDLDLQGAAAVRLGAVSFAPIPAQSASSESVQSLPILIDGAEPEVTPEVTRVCYDMVEDGQINIQDLVAFARQFGAKSPEPGTFLAGDFNRNGEVEIQDLVWFARNFGLKRTDSAALTFPENYFQDAAPNASPSMLEVQETPSPVNAPSAMEVQVVEAQSSVRAPVFTVNSQEKLQEMEIAVHKKLNEELSEADEP